jgi:hypothetical protein
MKVLGIIFAGALAAISQSAAASVVFMPADSNAATLTTLGTAQTMAPRQHPFSSGPVQIGQEITYRSNKSQSVIGYTGGYTFGSSAWSAGGAPMVGLNSTLGAMTFDFAHPLSTVAAEINWAKGFSGGAPIFMSIFNSANELLETFQFSSGDADQWGSGYYGFTRGNADISRLVLYNGYIGARNFYTSDNVVRSDYGSYGGGGGGGGQPVENLEAAVPEPGTWLLMILGFGATGTMLRRARQLQPALVRA